MITSLLRVSLLFLYTDTCIYIYVINEIETFYPSFADFSVSLRSSASFSLNLPLLLALLLSILM